MRGRRRRRIRLSWLVAGCVVLLRSGALVGAPCPASAVRSSDESAGGFIRVEGPLLRSPDGNEFRIRAIGAGSLGESPSEKDYAAIAALRLNAVTLILDHRQFYSPDAPTRFLATGWRRLDEHLEAARRHGLHVVLQMCGAEGDQSVPRKGAAFDYRLWVDAGLQERFLRLWDEIASRYANERQIIGYGILCEPVVAGTRKQWVDLATRAVSRIRAVDRNHVLFVERIYGEFGARREISGVDFDPEHAFFLVNDPNVVYQFYFFERDEYTHQRAPWREDRDRLLAYPDASFPIVYREAVNDRGRLFGWQREYLAFYLARQLEFGRRHNVPMFVWAFGLMKNCFQGQGGLRWLRDVLDLFEAQRLSWSYVDYREDAFGVSDNPDALRVLSDRGD